MLFSKGTYSHMNAPIMFVKYYGFERQCMRYNGINSHRNIVRGFR